MNANLEIHVKSCGRIQDPKEIVNIMLQKLVHLLRVIDPVGHSEKEELLCD